MTRLQATGRAQARYLWLLLVAGLLYALLAFGAVTESPKVLGLSVRPEVVLASAPAVLGFVVLALLGAVRAWTRARDALGLDRADSVPSEAFDAPNAIDLAVYRRRALPNGLKWLEKSLHYAYPLYVSVFVVEGVWLWVVLVAPGGAGTGGRVAFAIVGALCLVPAVVETVLWWRSRLTDERGLFPRTPKSPEPPRLAPLPGG